MPLVVDGLFVSFVAAVLVDAGRTLRWGNFAGRDEQIFAAVAGLWEQGAIPYRDVYDIKPPGIFVALRVAFTLWGHEPESLRRLALLLSGLSSLFLYACLRRAWLAIAAPITALAFLGLAVGDPTSTAFQFTEPWAACLAALALGFAVLHQSSAWWPWAVATGAMLTASLLCKPPALLYALPLALQLTLWRPPSSRWLPQTLRTGVLAAAGFVAVAGSAAAYFAWNGALHALYECVFVDAGRNYAGVTATGILSLSWWAEVAQRPSAELIPLEVPWVHLAAVGLLVLLTLLRPSRWIAVAWAWVAAAYFAIVVGPRAESHYLWIAWPAEALVLGLVVECASSREEARADSQAQRLLAGLVVAVLVLGPLWVPVYASTRLRDPVALGGPGYDIGQKIRELAQPGDTLHVADEPFDVYLYAGLRPVTRFLYWNAPHPKAIESIQEDTKNHPATFVVKHPAYIRPEPLHPGDIVGDYEYWQEVAGVGILRLRNRNWPPTPSPSPTPEPTAAAPP